MAKLRKIQFYRNGQVFAITNAGGQIGGQAYLVDDLKSAYVYAEASFKNGGKHNDMLDGEILLYRFSYDGQVHTLVGVVHATETGTKSLEVLANYDMLGAEISNEIAAAIAELDGSAIIATVNNNDVVTLKAGIVQTDGKVSQGAGNDIVLAKVAKTGAAADVTVATGIDGLDATNVQDALTELQGDITALQAIDPVVTTVVEGTGIKVTDNGTVNDHAYTVEANFTVDTIKYGENAGDKAGKTYIRIMDGEKLISETNAAAFVKDGFLQEVKLIEASEGQENVLRFTWNSDAGVQVTDIKVSDLCDVYTVGEGLVASEDGFTFSHQAGATGLTANTVFGSGSATANKITVKVPSVTVDKFGHVSALSETEVSLEIPESVASAVQTVTGDTYVTTEKSGTTVTLTTKTGDVAAGEDKLATAQSVKSYVDGKIGALDAEKTSTDGTNVQVKVTEVDGVITAVNVTTDNTINATDLTNAINALDAEKTSTDGTNVQVKVTEVDGVITAVNVTTDNTINATDLTNAINALDADESGSNTNQDITVQVVEKDGKIDEVKVTDTLKSVAHTGAAADVKLSEGVSVIAATDVEGALVEIATEINNMDLAATDVVALNADKNALQAGKISETDGKVTVETAETIVEFNQALSATNKVATMADVKAAAVSGQDAIVVGNAPQGSTTGQVVSLKINTSDRILSQNDTGLLANIKLEYDSANKKIKLLGKPTTTDGQTSPAVISEISANAFVKDGMLENAEIVSLEADEAGEGKPAGDYIKLTFNTDADQDPIYISVSDLCDVYTVDGEYLQLNASDKFKIEHKTQNAFTGTTADGQQKQVQFGATADATVNAAGNSIEFKVPSFKVDGAGHVTEANDKTVTVALPATRTAATVTVSEITNLDAENVQDALAELQGDIDAIKAVNWNGDGDGEGTGEIIVNDTNHTISHKQHTVTPTTSTNDTAVKSVVIPQLTVNDYGHITAIDNKTFNIDFNVPTVTGTTGQIVVTPTEGTEDVNYTVSLATVARVDNPTAENTAGLPSASSFADENNKFTYVKEVKTDTYGRVTGILTETVTEDFDAGTY